MLAVTLTPMSVSEPAAPDPCWLCGDRDLADAILNVLLFLPLGAGLRSWTGSRWRAIAICVLLSLGIEVLQQVIPGRFAGPSDIVFNGLGGALGAAVAGRNGLGWLSRVAGPGWPILLGGATALAHLAGGWLLGTELPGGRYYAFWVPELAHLEPTDARLVGAELAGMRIPHGWVEEPEGVRRRLASGSSLRLEARPGSSVNGFGVAGLFALYGPGPREVLLVGRAGDDLVLRHARRSGRLRLDVPDVRITGFFSGMRRDDRLTLVFGGERFPGESRCVDWRLSPAAEPAPEAASRGPAGGEPQCRVGLTPARGWATLLYEPVVRTVGAGRLPWVDAAWAAGLGLPLGLAWTGSVGWIGAGLIGLALALAPALGGLLPTPWWLYLSTLAGLALGRSVRGWALRRSPSNPA